MRHSPLYDFFFFYNSQEHSTVIVTLTTRFVQENLYYMLISRWLMSHFVKFSGKIVCD